MEIKSEKNPKNPYNQLVFLVIEPNGKEQAQKCLQAELYLPMRTNRLPQEIRSKYQKCQIQMIQEE